MRRKLDNSPQVPITAPRSGVTIHASIVVGNMNHRPVDPCGRSATTVADIPAGIVGICMYNRRHYDETRSDQSMVLCSLHFYESAFDIYRVFTCSRLQ